VNRISLKGVIVGGFTDVALTMVLGILLTIYAAAQLDVAHLTQDQLLIAIRANALFSGAQLLIGIVGSIFGGYVAAWLAKRNEFLNGALSSFLCVGIGVYSISAGHAALVEKIIPLVASPVLGLLGGYIRFIQMRRRSSQT
jgi:hypothetical protein